MIASRVSGFPRVGRKVRGHSRGHRLQKIMGNADLISIPFQQVEFYNQGLSLRYLS
jgi:hypothetical protein